MCARSLILVGLWVAAASVAIPAQAQTRYELTAPELNRTSQAILTESELRIVDQTGRQTVYLRDPTVDSNDGRFLAYRDNASGQIIRWPVTGRGPMQIGTASGGSVEFRTSRMQVQRLDGQPGQPILGGTAPRRILPPTPATPVTPPLSPVPDGVGGDLLAQVYRGSQAQPTLLRLGIRDERGQEWFLGHAGGRRLAMYPAGRTAEVDWFVVPAGRGYVRLQHQSGTDWLALAVGPGNALTIDPVSQDARQLWRVLRTTNGANGYWLESAFMPGYALNGTPGGAVALVPVGSGLGQIWLPLPPPAAPGFQPRWRTVSHELTPNAPLEPAQIDLFNSYAMPIVVLIGDRRTGAVRPVRIEPGAQVPVTFDRDAGASIVEVYETRSAGGVWSQQQLVTQIPPAPIYDLSVYEEFVQSIAIDRTGTSPNPIEDISVLPKSVGMILVPPGAALPARGRIDAYAEARAANNAGAVRRWDPKTFERPSPAQDPIQAALESVTRPAAPPPPPAAGTTKKF